MDFVQRAKALLRSTAKSGALKIMPLAAAAAMSMGAATFDPGTAFSLCDGDTMQFQSTGTVGGVTGIKIFNSSGGSCSTSGNATEVFLSAGAAGFGSGTFDAALQQLEITFEFIGSAFISESPTDYSWTLAVDINSGGAFNDITGVANSGELVSSATTGPLLIDMTNLAGQAFTTWSAILTLTKNNPEESFVDLSVQIPQNSIDINGVTPLVEDVPEPGTVMLMVAGGMAFLVRRRMK